MALEENIKHETYTYQKTAGTILWLLFQVEGILTPCSKCWCCPWFIVPSPVVADVPRHPLVPLAISSLLNTSRKEPKKKDSKVFSITFLVGFLLFSIFLGVTTRIYHITCRPGQKTQTLASGLLTNRITSPRSDSLSQTWPKEMPWRSLLKNHGGHGQKTRQMMGK